LSEQRSLESSYFVGITEFERLRKKVMDSQTAIPPMMIQVPTMPIN
jgi:hypothetical protein